MICLCGHFTVVPEETSATSRDKDRDPTPPWTIAAFNRLRKYYQGCGVVPPSLQHGAGEVAHPSGVDIYDDRCLQRYIIFIEATEKVDIV